MIYFKEVVEVAYIFLKLIFLKTVQTIHKYCFNIIYKCIDIENKIPLHSNDDRLCLINMRKDDHEFFINLTLSIINNIEISQYNEFQQYLDKYNIQSYLALPLYPPKVKICTCGLIPLYIDLVCFDVHYKYQ